jgi:hypothetical protein
MKKLLPIILAAAMVFSLAACNGDKNGGGGDGYDAFTKAMTDLRDAGTKLQDEGLTVQAESLYAFAGA